MHWDIISVWILRTIHKPFCFEDFWKYKLSVGWLSADKNFAGISARTNTIMPPPLQFQSNLKDDAYQEILNWPKACKVCLVSISNFL